MLKINKFLWQTVEQQLEGGGGEGGEDRRKSLVIECHNKQRSDSLRGGGREGGREGRWGGGGRKLCM